MLPHAILADIFLVSCILLLFYLQFSCGSSLVSPQHKCCWLCRQLLYVSFFFLLFFCFFNLEISDLLLSVPSVFSWILFCSLSCPSFSSFYYLFSSPPLFIHYIFWSPFLFSFQICYPFFSLYPLLDSVCFSLMFYYYSICSLSISLHLFKSFYLILLCYLLLLHLFSLYFLFLVGSNNTSCSVFLSSFLCFLFPSILFPFFCSFYDSFLLLFLFFLFVLFYHLYYTLLLFLLLTYYWFFPQRFVK